jgi:hypothetical protein
LLYLFALLGGGGGHAKATTPKKTAQNALCFCTCGSIPRMFVFQRHFAFFLFSASDHRGHNNSYILETSQEYI